MNHTPNARFIHFEGARNVRDLGGLAAADGVVRRRRLYRADGLSRLTERDLETFAGLGVRTIVDLRYDEERTRAPDRLPAGQDVRVVNRGFLPQGSLEMFEGVNRRRCDAAEAFELMRRNYARIPFEHAAEFADVLHELLTPDAAAHLVHCTSGKDRTGIAIALALRALGVSVADVVADYELSNLEHQPVDVFEGNAQPEAVAVIMAARPEYLLASLEAIDHEYGSIERYLERALGFGATERRALAASLID
ncbi:MAG: tyrosine-protein phosphatase [Gammaproteobacteria bacterium]